MKIFKTYQIFAKTLHDTTLQFDSEPFFLGTVLQIATDDITVLFAQN